MPVYNVEPYIEECLCSVAKQTYKGEMECILVDDCGTDNSMNVIFNFIEEYNGNIIFKVLHHERNRGLSAARNTGIENSTGIYLFFLDSDDFITHDCIEVLVSSAQKYNIVDIVQSDICNRQKGLCIDNKVREFYNDKNEITSLFLNRNLIPVTSWNKLIRVEFLRKNNLWFKENLIHEDELFNFFLARYVESIAIVCKGTYYYRAFRNDGLSQRNIDLKCYWWCQILSECLNNIPTNNRQIFLNFVFCNIVYFISFPKNIECTDNLRKVYRSLVDKSDVVHKILLWIFAFIPQRLRRNKTIYRVYREKLFSI